MLKWPLWKVSWGIRQRTWFVSFPLCSPIADRKDPVHSGLEGLLALQFGGVTSMSLYQEGPPDECHKIGAASYTDKGFLPDLCRFSQWLLCHLCWSPKSPLWTMTSQFLGTSWIWLALSTQVSICPQLPLCFFIEHLWTSRNLSYPEPSSLLLGSCGAPQFGELSPPLSFLPNTFYITWASHHSGPHSRLLHSHTELVFWLSLSAFLIFWSWVWKGDILLESSWPVSSAFLWEQGPTSKQAL